MELDAGGEDEDDDEEEQAAVTSKAAATSSKASNASGKRKAGATSFVSASEPKRQSKSIADEIRKTPEEVVAERHRSKSVQRTMKDYGTKSKEQKDVVDGHVADFLYENCLPLNIVNSRSWEILLEYIGQYGSDYVTPSYHDVRIPLLEKAKVKTDTLKEKHEKAWEEYGCSLMSDGWTDMSGRHLINFLVNSPEDKEFSDCIAKAKRTTRFIYAHTRILDLMRSLNGKKNLVRPGATCFATSFLTLTSMWSQRQTLKALFVSADWYASKLKITEAGKAAERTVMSMPFWQSVENCMRASQPLLKALRIVDGDESPAMPEIWAAMDVAKVHINEALSQREGLRSQVVAIIERRWDNQMEQKLHGAALFLNPSKFFAIQETNKRLATRLRSMFNDVLWKMVPDDDLQSKISNLADDYERTEGVCFTKQMAIKDREKKSPLLWWGAYGGLAYELQCLAKRIISLCASSSGCERNWSVFAHIHTKGRNRLEYKRLNKLSYVSYNRQMENRFQKLREEGSKGKRANALILEEFQWDNEWVDINAELVHQNEAQGLDGDGSNALRWSQVDVALGATEGLQGRNFPRRARGDASETSRPTGPYITYGRRVPNLIVNDPELRAELEEEVEDSDMENDDDGNDDSTQRNDKDQDFEVDFD
ncbi:hypothetical protein ACQ4PT_032951 [Festuca glaucescens]